mgnify:CR=1 FL=1
MPKPVPHCSALAWWWSFTRDGEGRLTMLRGRSAGPSSVPSSFDFERALQLDQTRPEFYLYAGWAALETNNLGQALEKAGNQDGAMREWEAAMRLNPTDSYRAKMEAAVQRRMGDKAMQAGQAAAAAVNEDGQLDAGGAAVVEEFVEGGLHGAAGVEHVVHEDHGGAVDVVRDDGRREFLGDRIAADVVAVEGDVDRARAGVEAGLFQAGGEAGGEDDAAVGDA